MGLDDIDEIDTKNMEIYSGVPVKKERRAVSGTAVQQPLKEKPADKKPVNVSAESKKQNSPSMGQSLLLPTENAVESLELDNEIDADLMLNALNETGGSDLLGGNMENQIMDPLVAENTIFDETSQVRFALFE